MRTTFDLVAALEQHTPSTNTQRAYLRWVDRFLADKGGLSLTSGDLRVQRMQRLPMKTVLRHVTGRKLANWLDVLSAEGHSRQSLDQARAALVVLADLLLEAGLFDQERVSEMHAVSVPPVMRKNEPEKLLDAEQLKQIMTAARDMATSPAQMLRNQLVAAMLCTMALRREELATARWVDLALQDNRPVLRLEDKAVEIPRPLLAVIDRWRSQIASTGHAPIPSSPLIRRIWKGGRISRGGLSPDGIWLIVRDAARYAGMEHVTPDDLRRSAVAGLRDAGISTEEISRLLRHRSVQVTERFLSKLPKSG